MIDRRSALKFLGGAAVTTALGDYSAWTTGHLEQKTQISSGIESIRSRYTVSREITNIENGYFGVMTDQIKSIYLNNITQVNTELSAFARLEFSSIFSDTYQNVRKYMELPENSVVLTRNATEALNIAIQGCPLQPGDEVVISQLDYNSALACWQMLEKTKGIVLVKIQIPLHPQSTEEIIELYASALTEKTKVVLLTHVNHLTGLILPVKEIIARMPEHITTILDAAHSFEHIPLSIADINPDMAIINFHKWFGAPVGVGMLYVKPSKVRELMPLYGSNNYDSDNILKLANFGTLSFPTIMTLNRAVQLQDKSEMPIKTNYLQQLKEAWMVPMRHNDKIELLTPVDANWSRSIASFKIKGMESAKVQETLLEKYRILIVTRKLNEQTILRVTPHWHNDFQQMHSLVNALNEMTAAVS